MLNIDGEKLHLRNYQPPHISAQLWATFFISAKTDQPPLISAQLWATFLSVPKHFWGTKTCFASLARVLNVVHWILVEIQISQSCTNIQRNHFASYAHFVKLAMLWSFQDFVNYCLILLQIVHQCPEAIPTLSTVLILSTLSTFSTSDLKKSQGISRYLKEFWIYHQWRFANNVKSANLAHLSGHIFGLVT